MGEQRTRGGKWREERDEEARKDICVSVSIRIGMGNSGLSTAVGCITWVSSVTRGGHVGIQRE